MVWLAECKYCKRVLGKMRSRREAFDMLEDHMQDHGPYELGMERLMEMYAFVRTEEEMRIFEEEERWKSK
jgi:hypothetical protein